MGNLGGKFGGHFAGVVWALDKKIPGKFWSISVGVGRVQPKWAQPDLTDSDGLCRKVSDFPGTWNATFRWPWVMLAGVYFQSQIRNRPQLQPGIRAALFRGGGSYHQRRTFNYWAGLSGGEATQGAGYEGTS